jgi:cyclopropane fatty-acyl-phospholipid synthase-like methyltransferase
MAMTNGRSSRELAALIPLQPGQTVLDVGTAPGPACGAGRSGDG